MSRPDPSRSPSRAGTSALRIAVDLGASSGRVVVGRIGDDQVVLDEVARFPTDPRTRQRADGTSEVVWDFPALLQHVGQGIIAGVRRHPGVQSVAVDSWAVDFGLLRDGQVLDEPRCYRDPGHQRGVRRVHDRVPFEELHARNGLQFLPFTTCYQLLADDQPGRGADHLLLVPDLVTHALTGSVATERTNASTTGLLDPRTQQWDEDLLGRLGIPRGLVTELVDPGAHRGLLVVEGQVLDVLTAASHDTASAVAATPLDPERAAYVSLGTWALVGVELQSPVLTEQARTANFTNEGGAAGTVRFLRNVTGTWLLTETLREWQAEDQLGVLLAEAAVAPRSVAHLDVDDPVFLPPGRMASRIIAWLRDHDQPVPATRAALVRLLLDEVAASIAHAVHQAAQLSGVRVSQVHVVGGGARNELLCQLLADEVGMPVVAGPVEATAVGNLLTQAGATADQVARGRAAIEATIPLRRHLPRPRRS